MRQEIIHEAFIKYSEAVSDKELTVLEQLAAETKANVPGAQMLTGHVEGALLQLISKLVNPKTIVELGTYTGYSAICLAMGLQNGGKLHTIDIDDRWQPLRDKYWQLAGLKNSIQSHLGNAIEVLDSLNETIDLAYIDADKKSYDIYFEKILSKMSAGGIIIADNVLFHGEVTLPAEEQSNAAKYIAAFNQKISQDTRVEKVMLTVRDGVYLIRKK